MSEINSFKEDLYEGMMYGALTMNSKNCEKLLKEIDNLQNQLQQKENIIKEVREKVKSRYEEDKKIFRGSYEWKFILDFEEELLEILDKEVN